MHAWEKALEAFQSARRRVRIAAAGLLDVAGTSIRQPALTFGLPSPCMVAEAVGEVLSLVPATLPANGCPCGRYRLRPFTALSFEGALGLSVPDPPAPLDGIGVNTAAELERWARGAQSVCRGCPYDPEIVAPDQVSATFEDPRSIPEVGGVHEQGDTDA
jgi:hypothetical protein